MTTADISDAKRIAHALNSHNIFAQSNCRWAACSNGGKLYVVLLSSAEGSVSHNPGGVISTSAQDAFASLLKQKGMNTGGRRCACAQTSIMMENCASHDGARPRIGGIITREGVNKDVEWLYRHLGDISHQLAKAEAAPSGIAARATLTKSAAQGATAQYRF